jgi:predicted naringenin-chalcone synthase
VTNEAMMVSLLGLGTALPSTRLTQEQGARVAQILCLDPRQAPLLPTLYRQTGITGRNLVLEETLVDDLLEGTRHSNSVFLPKEQGPDQGPTTCERMEIFGLRAPSLAMEASASALNSAGMTAGDVTHLVTVSCTGFAAPGVDIALIRGLGLTDSVQRTNVGFMGCHGALNGLRVARGLVCAEPDAVVLLCAVELCSIHYHYGWDPKRVVGNALFGDGSAAAVIGNGGNRRSWVLAAHGACLFPNCDWAMTWDVGDHGFTMHLSTKVPSLIAKHLRPWLDGWLAQHGETVARIGSWAIHPGGPRVLSAVADSLGLDARATAASGDILTRYGNMSSPTILFILDQLRRADAPKPCVALAFGPGLAVEAALLT